jgi:hypothetical protein
MIRPEDLSPDAFGPIPADERDAEFAFDVAISLAIDTKIWPAIVRWPERRPSLPAICRVAEMYKAAGWPVLVDPTPTSMAVIQRPYARRKGA